MRTIRRAVHIDFHTMPDIPDFGANFDAEDFARTLKEARVEFINAFAKCNIGWAYYPTKVGVMHPHLSFDLFGNIVEACHAAGIGVAAYFNVGLDHEMARRHRDWTIVNKDGQVIYGDRTGNYFRTMCYRSGYRDYILAMIREVVESYPVDGVFLDSLAPRPCYGNECCEGMRDAGMDPLNDDHAAAYAKQNILEFCREVKEIVGPEKHLYLNGPDWNDTAEWNTHHEIVCLPSSSGYDRFPAQVAYARNLGKQTVYMTGRFHVDWGDFGGLKSKASLLNDCWDAIGNAATMSVGDHMHPRDGLDPAVYRLIGEVYREIERYEPWTDHAKAAAEIGILTLPGGKLDQCHNGAVRMLGELKYTYDIIDEGHDFHRYKVLLLPDGVAVDEGLRKKLADYLVQGGGVVSSGRSGLNPEGTGFALEAWNMRYEGEDPWNSSYFKMLKKTEDDIPDMLCGMHHQAILLQAGQGAESIADYYEPYFNREWDGFHTTFYTPPNRYAGRPAVCRSGNIFQICFNVFTAYMDYSVPAHKFLVNYCLKQLLPDPLVRCENIPSTARVTVTEKDHMKMIHVKTTHPEPRGRYHMIEDRPVLPHAVVSLKVPRADKVYLAPTKTVLAYERRGDYIRIPLPDVDGYVMVVVETGGDR